VSIHVDTVTSLDAFLTATRTGLMARAGLAGVNVFSGPILDDKERGEEYILLGGRSTAPFEVDATYEYSVGTPQQLAEESYDVPCELLGIVTGSGETGIVAARQRGLTLLAEVHSWFKANDTAGGIVRDCRISGYKATQLIFDDARRCLKVEFTVAVTAMFTPA
jgi:hypothetical protein